MAKGYLMANLRVKDQDIFKEFSSVALPLIESFGGKLLARGPCRSARRRRFRYCHTY